MKSTKWTIAVVIAFLAGAFAVSQGASLFRQESGGGEHSEAREHDDHDNHEAEGEGEHGERHDEREGESRVHLDSDQMAALDITVSTADPADLRAYIEVPGEIQTNADREIHIVPRVAGVVREVRKTLGDQVKEGEVLAVLESRELADMKSNFLAARERIELAESNLERESKLKAKGLATEQEFLEAKQREAEAHIELDSSEQQLYSLGLSSEQVAALPRHAKEGLTNYEIVSPFDGTIIEKHLALGEAVNNDTQLFIIADLRTVWCDLSLYQKDLPHVRQGQDVEVRAENGDVIGQGELSYISALVDEETRTALGRVVLANANGSLRPGTFLTARIACDTESVKIAVLSDAVQSIDDRPTVFVKDGDAFEPRTVTIGRSDGERTEILSGVDPGEEYVARGAFTLKAELAKGSFGDGHNH